MHGSYSVCVCVCVCVRVCEGEGIKHTFIMLWGRIWPTQITIESSGAVYILMDNMGS